MKIRRTVVALFLGAMDVAVIRDRDLPWDVTAFAHELVYIAQVRGMPFGYTFSWTPTGPVSDDLTDEIGADVGDQVLDDHGRTLIADIVRIVYPPSGIDRFAFDQWLLTICMVAREHSRGKTCPAIAAAVLTEMPHLAEFVPTAVERICL
jgi:hypothetical protein